MHGRVLLCALVCGALRADRADRHTLPVGCGRNDETVSSRPHTQYRNFYGTGNVPQATRAPDSRIPQPIVVRSDFVPPTFNPSNPNDPAYLAAMQRYRADVERQLKQHNIDLNNRPELKQQITPEGHTMFNFQVPAPQSPPQVSFQFSPVLPAAAPTAPAQPNRLTPPPAQPQQQYQPAQQQPVQQNQAPPPPPPPQQQQQQHHHHHQQQQQQQYQPPPPQPEQQYRPPPQQQYQQQQQPQQQQHQYQQQQQQQYQQQQQQYHAPPVPQPQAQYLQPQHGQHEVRQSPRVYESYSNNMNNMNNNNNNNQPVSFQLNNQPPTQAHTYYNRPDNRYTTPALRMQIPPTPPSHQSRRPEATPSYSDRLAAYNKQMEERRRALAQQKEELARELQQQQQVETQADAEPASVESAPVPFTDAYRARHEPTQNAAPPPPATPAATRRPPKTTRQPPVYASTQNRYNFGLGGRANNRESVHQQQQRRRNQLAAQRQREREERQRAELAQLQRAELQRQIAEEQARQAAALAALKLRQQAAAPPGDEPAPLYPEGEEKPALDLAQYYEDLEESVPSTTIPQVQLESPVEPSPMWTTGDDISDHPDFLFDLPCNGFSDEICYQQQSQLPPEEVHKCCQTKVVLTDQCVPGKCSNATVQLCCIQKFLQSKFKCCNDKKQGEPVLATDSFSRCCFDEFVVADDPCCPKAFSEKQWMNVHELCLPNVNVDLSNVKVPQRAAAGMTTVFQYDFAKTDRWRFECRYGAHVPQYSYFTEDAFKKSKESGAEE